MTFFEQDFVRFFQELRANNERDWFNANKKRFKQNVQQPFKAFLAMLLGRIHEDDPEIPPSPDEAVFRIYRDVRFSQDKSPYKTHMGALIAPGGRREKRPGNYIQMNDEQILFYGGAYWLEKNELEKARARLLKEPGTFQAIVDDPAFRKAFGEVQGEKYKRIPPHLKEDAEKQPWLFYKSFYFGTSLPVDMIFSDELPDKLFELYKTGKAFNLYMRETIA